MILNKIFRSHMVFARNCPIRVFGEGKGVVSVRFAGNFKTISSDKDEWMLELPSVEYGGPYEMEVILNGEQIVLNDIYVGEVYLLAGQSNLQFKLNESNAPKEMYESNNKLRLYTTDRIEKNEYYTSDDGWLVADINNIDHWSALGYLVGNALSKEKDIPVGLIACYQGASIIESWVPKDTFKKIGIDIPLENRGWGHSCEEYSEWNGDGVLYDYAFSQVRPYPVSAVIWYQGESDSTVEEGKVYADELAELIRIWRRDLLNDKLPFIVIQIANFIRGGEGWPYIQQAQIDIQSKAPFVKTIISADVCEDDDIHPPTKHKLAERITKCLLNE